MAAFKPNLASVTPARSQNRPGEYKDPLTGRSQHRDLLKAAAYKAASMSPLSDIESPEARGKQPSQPCRRVTEPRRQPLSQQFGRHPEAAITKAPASPVSASRNGTDQCPLRTQPDCHVQIVTSSRNHACTCSLCIFETTRSWLVVSLGGHSWPQASCHLTVSWDVPASCEAS